MKITKDYENLKYKNGNYIIIGDLISNEDIEIELDQTLIVIGEIEAGYGIEAGSGIKARDGIEAGLGIKAGCGIDAGWEIKAGGMIEAGEGIKAGCGIEAGEGIKAGCGIEAGEGIKAGEGIEAGEEIEAGWEIEAGYGIEAGGGIEAGCGIEAGLTIKCKWIKTKLRIFAGICNWKTPTEIETTITCEEIKEGTIAFGKLNLIQKKDKKKMTLSGICDELGYDIEIIEEEENNE